MAIRFRGSSQPTIGVEVELQLVDRRTRELAQAAPEILAAFPGEGWVKHELLQSTIEINTGICRNVRGVEEDLAGKLEKVRRAADRLGVALTAAGTHPFSRWEDQKMTENERYRRLIDLVQWPARRLLIFGLHVHIGVPDGETAIAVVNHLGTWLPHLLALTASSPFWEGKDTGLASSRVKVFECLPTAGLPHRHENWREFERVIEALIRARAIETIREIWWDIRPHHNFGTVEVRVCDAVPTLGETIAVTALIQALIVHLQRRVQEGHPPRILHPRLVKENKWRAARWSTQGTTIVDEEGCLEPIAQNMERLLETLEPLFGELGSEEQLPRLQQMVHGGPSYARQRAVHAATGDMRSVVDSLIRESEENRPGRP